jgi:PAS domain S-box-containing protein
MDSFDKIKILLAEDDDFDKMAFRRLIKKTDIPYELNVFSSAKEALVHFKTNTEFYDCIFTDYRLPGETGLILLKSIKKINEDIPVVVLTSHGDEKIAVDMMKAGAFDYLPKADLNVQKMTNLISSIQKWTKLQNEKKIIKTKLEENQHFINEVTKASPNIIFVYNLAKNKNVYTSRNVYKELGYSKSKIVEFGDDIFKKLLHPEDQQKLDAFFFNIKHSSNNRIIEFEYRLRDSLNEWQWFLDRTSVFKRDKNGDVLEIIGTSINITSRKKNEQSLLEAKQFAEKAAKIKSDFLSNMSHEIRTPMNAIMGLTEILMDSDFKGQDRENLEIIRQSASNLMVIINDILDYSKMEAGKVKIESVGFLLDDYLKLIRKSIEKKAKENNVEFVISKSSDVPAALIGDPYRLNQILLNLLSNAIKFTHVGKIELKISVIDYMDKRLLLNFKVVDSGVGIPRDKLDTIFESFTQANVYTTRKYGGTGLGLAITKKLVTLMEGEIFVDSTEGKGSTFTVIMPFCVGEESIEYEKKAKNRFEKSFNDIRILVVEDQKINQMVIKQILGKWNTPYFIANNGKEAIDILSKEDFDLVCMDLQMPVCDGFEATKRIRTGKSHVRNPQIPIIALSADALPETKEKVFEVGMNDYITKPPDLELLYNKIKQLL